MTIGTDTFQAHGTPLLPNKGIAITQQASGGGADLVTLSLNSTATDDALVIRLGTTESMYIKFNGHINLKSYTTTVTTGLTKGDLFLVWHNTVPRLAIAIDTTTAKYNRFKTKTKGRLT